MVQKFTNVFSELLLDNPKLKKRIAEYQALDLWNTAVSTSAAKHSAADKINKGILFVNTSSGSWAQQLSLLKPKIMKNLNEKLSEPLIKDIRFKPVGFRREEESDLAKEGKAKKRKRKCSICGVEWVWEGERDVCPQCLRVGKRDREIKILREIASVPWVKFAQLKKEIPDLEIDEFDKKKRYLKNKIYDTIKKICEDLERGDKTSQAKPCTESHSLVHGKLRSLVCDFVFLQTEISPKDLDESVIKNVIGDAIYSLVKTEKVRGLRGHGKKQSK